MRIALLNIVLLILLDAAPVGVKSCRRSDIEEDVNSSWSEEIDDPETTTANDATTDTTIVATSDN